MEKTQMDSYQNTLLTSLHQMKEKEIMTDVSLKLPDDSTIACHKLVLVAASPFFEAMFQSGLKESVDGKVELKFAESAIIRMLVDYIYSGKIKINEQNVQTLVEGSDFLFLKDLKDLCGHFIATTVRSSNCLEVCRYAKRFGLDKAASRASEIIAECFEEVVGLSEFETFTEEELVDAVSDDRLKAENEDIVFESVVRWVNVDPDQRKEAFPRIASLIRFPLCTPESLIQVVSCEPLMWSPECMKLLAEAQHSQFHSGKHPVDNARTTPRNNREEHLVRMYNDDKDNVYFEYISNIDSDDKRGQWKKISLPMKFKCDQQKIFVSPSGGSWIGRIDAHYIYFVKLPSMKITTHNWKKPRFDQCTILHLNGKMFAFGGRDGFTTVATMESLDVTLPRSEWKTETPMLRQMHSGQAIHLLNKIYIFGGYSSGRYRVTQKYDLVTGEWQLCSEIPNDFSIDLALPFRKKIFCFGIMCCSYDPGMDSWTVISSPPDRLGYDMQATVWKGKILVTNGKNTSGFVYDPSIDRWSIKEKAFDEKTSKYPTKLLCTMRF